MKESHQKVLKVKPPGDFCSLLGLFHLGGDTLLPESFKRKLTAIFSADVAGDSRLMGENEAETAKTSEAYNQVMFTCADASHVILKKQGFLLPVSGMRMPRIVQRVE